MEIKLKYTKDELSLLLDGLNNAIIALQSTYRSAQLGCDIPSQFIPLFENKSYEEIDNIVESRLSAINRLYTILLEQEEKLFL